MAATFTPIDFRDVQVGDRLRFLTRDTGFGGYGIHDRAGNVVRITEKTVQIICDDGDTALIRRANWRSREPRKEA